MRFEVATESARQGDHRRGDRVAFACKPHSVIIVIWLESALSAAFCAGPEHVCFRTHTRIPKIEFIASFGGAHRYLAAFLPTRIFFSFFFLLFSGCSFRPSRHNYAVRGGSRGAWRTRIAIISTRCRCFRQKDTKSDGRESRGRFRRNEKPQQMRQGAFVQSLTRNENRRMLMMMMMTKWIVVSSDLLRLQ
jgi:hypothetical protein